uniref:Uncharacterized protein n=1 Tax=Anguilla anguilla TaxID=7936 RepID=A0A0E9UEN5_ANGAN
MGEMCIAKIYVIQNKVWPCSIAIFLALLALSPQPANAKSTATCQQYCIKLNHFCQ